jgi:hypothetical protein
MKLGQPTGEMTECDGSDVDRDTECKNLVRVLHDPYKTAVIALCTECNASGEVYGPIDEPYWEDEHDGTPECCAACKHRAELEQAEVDRYAAECDSAHEEELERLGQRPPTLCSRIRYWLASVLKKPRADER